MIDLKTSEEIEKDIRISLVCYLIFGAVGFICFILSLFYIGMITAMIVSLFLAVDFNNQRNSDLIRYEMRTRRVK